MLCMHTPRRQSLLELSPFTHEAADDNAPSLCRTDVIWDRAYACMEGWYHCRVCEFGSKGAELQHVIILRCA